MTLFGVLSSSLSYEKIQQNSAEVIKDSLLSGFNLSTGIEGFAPLMQLYCSNNSASEYVFSSAGYTFDIPCEIVMQGKDAIIDEGVRDLIYRTYYTEYDCNFFDCIKQSPFFLVSEKAYDYLNNKFYFFLGLSFILILGLFLFTEKKTNTFIIAGVLVIISSLIFFKIDSIFALFSDKLIFNLLGIFFSESFSFSVNFLIAGIILLVLGIIFKIFKLGFVIQKFISKFKKSEKAKSEPVQKQPAKNSKKKRSK